MNGRYIISLLFHDKIVSRWLIDKKITGIDHSFHCLLFDFRAKHTFFHPPHNLVFVDSIKSY